MTKDDYNMEPIFYCEKCLSLKIRDVEHIENSEYCDECGSTEIKTANINDWDSMYIARYGHSFLDKF